GGSIFSASELQSVNLPATIQFINPEFFSGCVSLRSISISSQNETYSSFDGMVFAKDFSQLLLIPESKEGAAIIPDATTSVPAKVLSHRPLVTSLSAGDGSTAFASENGILYTKDKKMLVACPGGYGDAFVISENVESIGPDAFAGNVFRSIIVRGTVTNIDPTAFSAQSQSEAAVVLRGGESYAAHKAVWEQAGFSHFAEPAEPGTSFEPNGKTDDDTSGFAYTMLPDYTLSVSWKGSAEPDANLSIPAAAEIGGVTYRVSEIAPYAFKEKLLESVAMPASVTTVGEGAFQGCANLKSVSLVEGLLLVDALAFERTALAAVILPTTIGMIGERAFADNADLARIVALSSRTEAMPNAIEGCSGVSILVPYQESGAYHWTPGIAALGNHIEPYGFVSDEESLSLKVGETSNLFNAGKVFVPASCEITYSYPATSVSVDEDGFVKGKAVGTADVVAAVTLNGIELSRGFRSVEVAQQVISDTEDGVFGVKEMPEVRMSPLPLTRMMLALEGNEIAPRADMKGISGGCTWDIDASGKLTIKPTSGDSGVLASFNNTESGAPWYEFRTLITSVDMQAGVSGGSSIVCMFAGCINLTVLDLSSFNTGNVINMAGMFDGCTKLTSLNLSKFVTSKVVFTANMFRDCSSLVELDLSSFDTVAVEGMDGMFNGCSSLAALDLSNFNTAKTVNMGVMFHGCKSLINLDLSNFNTENVKHMDNMFSGCSSLTALNLAKFITSN
ncbi:MAG: leucine-rich repeat protein, partial [Raoultibacter sp.]